MSIQNEENNLGKIAIIGMAINFPGAKNTETFWSNLSNGVESVKFFQDDELRKMGINKALIENRKFVVADAVLDDIDMFDAGFFDYSAREAEIMDPQHRLFLESAWEAMDASGYNSEQYEGCVAVYCGANLSGYMIRNIYSNSDLVEKLGSFKIMLACGQDFLATKVSFKMNYKGPSVNVNTLCSSSAVAVHYACQALNGYDCDIAIAGGVSLQVSIEDSLFYQEGGIGSSDGHCHAYDSRASGTVSGSGAAVLVLKRLEDAIADGDNISAVILGTGINNDGASKNSYTAPNVDGQAECIAQAIAMSGINPETVTYIDGHGTGTNLGDPIEIAALTKAYRAYTDKKQFCAIGSVKTNLGHLVNAGGLASLIKTVLSMQHKMIPPSLNFEKANPQIDFINSPFYVNTNLAKWDKGETPLRAGISSFGIGGTNVHIILEEAPENNASEKSNRQYQLISLSAKTETGLEKMTQNLSAHVENSGGLNLADIAYTLHLGRRNFNYRRFILCSDIEDLAFKLKNTDNEDVITHFQKPKEQSVAFMFPELHGEIINLRSNIYENESVFRESVNGCAEILKSLIGKDIRDIQDKSDRKELEHQAIFIFEYSIAKLWISWGVEPDIFVGKGVGEYVAACCSGDMSVEDALRHITTKERGIFERAENAALKEVLEDSDQIVLEMDLGNIGLLNDNDPAYKCLLMKLGKFWLAGGKIEFEKFYFQEQRHRIALPTYPFERKRYWIEEGQKRSGDESKLNISVETRLDNAGSQLTLVDRPDLDTEYVAPRNRVEEIISNKWEKYLGFRKIGINDDFFDLGGHSLIAAAIATELSKTFNVQIPMSTLFETTTISSVASLIYAYNPAVDEVPSKGVARAVIDDEEMEEGVI